MILRQPEWARNVLDVQDGEGDVELDGRKQKRQSPVTELVVALSDQRVYREVVWSLKRGLRDARSEFSFVRVRGLNALAKFMSSAVSDEKVIELFRDCQSYRELQVVPVLFDYTLAPRKRLAKNLSILTPGAQAASSDVESSPTSVEVALGLRVLEGCCLLYNGCRTTASRHAAVSELIDLFLAGGPSVQSHCLDGLLALMLESSSNQKEFERVHGLRKFAEMLRNNHLDPVIRLRIAEFIVILISQILPSANKGFGPAGEDSKPAWMTKWAQQELVELLGEESSAVVDDIIDAGRHKFSDQEGQQTATLRYAQQLLHLASSF
ncbi:hypothetical protein KC19_2G049000 [Ceratodon purpureus]|uniref:Uncharacterized protein n=1 Tax=Ceratodon purpureus TaxID=3225 RepID=A0A8T0IU68_CERPU|nr:hypothetical protein KC19_2G049000 [Ceratodon purpureus]